MRVKSVSELCGNEILAEPVLTDEKMILISRGSRLKKEYVPLIRSLGIDTLMVEDPYENYEMPSRIIDYSVFGKFVERVQRVMENHIYHKNKSLREFEVIANEVVKEVSKIPENIIIDINARIVNLYEHTVMVTLVSVFVARLLHLDQVRQYNIAVGALLHDLGLRYITTGYVNRDWEKEDPIEAFEYKKHTILGYSALDEESWIPEVSKKMVLFHHERLDGSGFPMRRRDFAMECRIIQACDAFDSYITGMECIRIPLQDAIGKIQEGIIHKYDRKVVETLLSKIAYYPVGTAVKMSNQAEGIVVLQTEDPKCPVVLDFHSGESEKKLQFNVTKGYFHSSNNMIEYSNVWRKENREVHKFLRAIGFSDITKKDLEMILDEVITRPEIMKITKDSEGNEFAELSGSFAANAGITVRGTYQEDDSFHMDYYYPYVFGTSITTNEQIDVEKHAEKESYAGVCDEVNLGVTLIFYIQNVADYLAETNRHLSKIHYGAMIAGLSTEGKILCPVVERKKMMYQLSRKMTGTIS